MTAGFFAPLPPARSGVADYAAALLTALRERGEVRMNSDRADVYLYHLGNNQLHRGIYSRALERPGVIVLHDAVLHHFFLGGLEEREYVKEFVYNYGEWNRDLAQELWRGRARSGTDPRYFGYPMLRRVAEKSRAVVVHNPAAARMVREHCGTATVAEIPHLFVPQAPEPDRERSQGFRFGVLGYLRESKRLPVVLRAFERVRREVPRATLLVAGEFASSDLERAVRPLLDQPGVIRAGHAPEREFRRLAASCDACINLRFPGAGETSGITVRMMGIGKPVLLTEGEETARFPEDACLRVPAGTGEREALEEYMIWLASFPEAAREVGRRAAAHIATHHSICAVADQYWKVLDTCVKGGER